MMKSFIFLTGYVLLTLSFNNAETTFIAECPNKDYYGCTPPGWKDCPSEFKCVTKDCNFYCRTEEEYYGCHPNKDDCDSDKICCYNSKNCSYICKDRVYDECPPYEEGYPCLPDCTDISTGLPFCTDGEICCNTYSTDCGYFCADPLPEGRCPSEEYVYCDLCKDCSTENICCLDEECNVLCQNRSYFYGCFDSNWNSNCSDGQFCCFQQNECRHKCVNPEYSKEFCPEDRSLYPGNFIRTCDENNDYCSEDEMCCQSTCPDVKSCMRSERKTAKCPASVNVACCSKTCTSDFNCTSNDQLCCSRLSGSYCCDPEYEDIDRGYIFY